MVRIRNLISEIRTALGSDDEPLCLGEALVIASLALIAITGVTLAIIFSF